MQLLVSVRSAAEVGAAVEGGADIIDAKEPSRGSLGAVDAAALAAIAHAVPDGLPLSIALGDLSAPGAVAGAMELIRAVPRAPAKLYVKVGLAGVAQPELARSVLEAAVDAARQVPQEPDVVAVAYADYEDAGAISPPAVFDAAAAVGARGVLLDTWTKDGRPLFAWAGPSEIRTWLDGARSRGLLTALAGSLSRDHLDLLRRLAPDVFGVRGAVCEGGRSGIISAHLVRQLAGAKARSAPSLEALV